MVVAGVGRRRGGWWNRSGGDSQTAPTVQTEERSGPLVTCACNPCKSTGSTSSVSTGDLPVLPVQVTN